MTDRIECLICGRPALPSGEPACDCVTHSLFRPVGPPTHGPDPADVALFPPEPPRPPRPARPVHPGRDTAAREEITGPPPAGAHRKPRHRTRLAVAASGAVAAVVGGTALAVSLFGGHGRGSEVSGGPTLAVPDGGYVPDLPDVPDEEDPAGTAAPSPEPATGDGLTTETAPSPSPTAPQAQRDEAPQPSSRTGGSGTGGGSPQPAPSGSPSPTAAAPSPEPEPDPDPEPDPVPDPTDGPEQPGPTAPDSPQPLVLREGDEGPEVAELQQRLLQLRWVYHGDAHGYYDRATRDAVARFQTAYGVHDCMPGVYDLATRRVLQAHTLDPGTLPVHPAP